MATATPTRRRVRYSSLDEVVADAARAVGAELGHDGQLVAGPDSRASGHRSRQNDRRISVSAPRGRCGPSVGSVFKKRLLVKGLTPGFKLNPRAAAVLVPERPMRRRRSSTCVNRPSD